jgi:hypothetical protein
MGEVLVIFEDVRLCYFFSTFGGRCCGASGFNIDASSASSLRGLGDVAEAFVLDPSSVGASQPL